LKLLAKVTSDPSSKEKILQQLKALASSDANASTDKTFSFVSAAIYMLDDNIKEALKVISTGTGVEL
jgi:hypothetical protein